MSIHIDREVSVSLSGVALTMGAVSLVDKDSDVQANVTMAGLAVDVTTPRVIGDSLSVNIDATSTLLDLTSLADGGYPITVELEARGAAALVKQGSGSVTLPAVAYRIKEDDWRVCTVSGTGEAYFRVQQEDTSFTGVLVATRIDSLL